jgi:hypothetical protein
MKSAINRSRARLKGFRQARAARAFSTYSEPAEELPIWPLVSPLRYDVVVRLDHFRFIERNEELAKRDYEAYFRAALEEPYFVWFRDIFCKRFHPDLLESESILENSFHNQLRKARRLFSSFTRNGYDAKRPLMIKTAVDIVPTETGKELSQKYFVGDGCHRLALLLSAGERSLSPRYFRIRGYESLLPVDNTQPLIAALGLRASDYFGFYSLRFTRGEPSFRSREALLAHVERHHPAELAETERIIAADEPFLVHDK